VAALDRGARGRRYATADAVAVSGRSLRRSAGGRLNRPRQAVAVAVAPATAVGCVLAGVDAVARTTAGSVLVEAAGVEPQRACPRESGGTRWDQVLFVLVAYRLLAPGSEWRLHREWFQRSALADLLGEDAGLAEIHKLYRCHDRLLAHKQAVFDHLTGRWRDLFNISYDVLLYDLTSTYLEADPPFPEDDKRRFGYSRDHRPDCVQIIIALVVTPEGLPLAYEVLPGNTADKTTLRGFLERIERQYGKARRVWLMDRGVPTEEVLAEMPTRRYITWWARRRAA
jgi:transposase